MKILALAAIAALSLSTAAYAQSGNPNNCSPASANCEANHKTSANEPGPASNTSTNTNMNTNMQTQAPEQRANMPNDNGGSTNGATVPLAKPGERNNAQHGG